MRLRVGLWVETGRLLPAHEIMFGGVSPKSSERKGVALCYHRPMAEPERSIFDTSDDQAEERALAAADADIAAGRGHPHEQVRRWLERLASGKYEPFDPADMCE